MSDLKNSNRSDRLTSDRTESDDEFFDAISETWSTKNKNDSMTSLDDSKKVRYWQ